MIRIRALAFALTFALMGAGCASSGAAPDAAPTNPAVAGAGGGDFAVDDWIRRVAPFRVLDPSGEPYAFPFLGGFNVPRPQLVDIDGDGDLDLFVQERADAVMFFENRQVADGGVGTAGGAPEFVWRTSKFQDLDIGEWFRFVDMDGDGDPDLLTEQRLSLIRYLRNDDGRFVTAEDTIRDASGEVIYSDRQNIPNVADIDADGRPDLFIGRLEGTVTRYEAVTQVGDELPTFEHVTDRFEDIEIVAEVMMGPEPSLHGANSMVFADVDEDGDFDLFWGDFFEPGLLLIENTGAPRAPSLRGEPIPFPPGDPIATSGFNVPAVADFDGDGDLDVMIGVLGGAYNPSLTTADNLYLLENTGDGYELATRRFLHQIDLGAESMITFGDIDGDGDADLLAAPQSDPEDLETSRIVVFENTGAAELAGGGDGAAAGPAFRHAGKLDIRGSHQYSPELVDLDADGDLDLLLGTWNEGVLIAWNEGSPTAPDWAVADAPLVELTRGSHTVPAAADVDADGLLDLVVGEASGTLNYYRNVGSAGEPAFELVSDEWGGVDVGRRAAPTFVDLDGDGRPELVAGTERGGPLCLRITDAEPSEIECPLPGLPLNGAPHFVDIDGDGDLDLFSGALEGGVFYFENSR